MAKDLILESTTLWDYPTQNYGDKPHEVNGDKSNKNLKSVV